MKICKSILTFLAVAALTLTSTVFAAETGGKGAHDGEPDGEIYLAELDTVLLELDEAETRGFFVDSFLFVKEKGKARLVYCYNDKRANPSAKGTDYAGADGFTGQEHDKATEKKVSRPLRAGYPFDAYELRAKHQLNGGAPKELALVTEELSAKELGSYSRRLCRLL